MKLSRSDPNYMTVWRISGETLHTELVPIPDEFKPEDPLIASIAEAQVAQEA